MCLYTKSNKWVNKMHLCLAETYWVIVLVGHWAAFIMQPWTEIGTEPEGFWDIGITKARLGWKWKDVTQFGEMNESLTPQMLVKWGRIANCKKEKELIHYMAKCVWTLTNKWTGNTQKYSMCKSVCKCVCLSVCVCVMCKNPILHIKPFNASSKSLLLMLLRHQEKFMFWPHCFAPDIHSYKW